MAMRMSITPRMRNIVIIGAILGDCTLIITPCVFLYVKGSNEETRKSFSQKHPHLLGIYYGMENAVSYLTRQQERRGDRMREEDQTRWFLDDFKLQIRKEREEEEELEEEEDEPEEVGMDGERPTGEVPVTKTKRPRLQR